MRVNTTSGGVGEDTETEGRQPRGKKGAEKAKHETSMRRAKPEEGERHGMWKTGSQPQRRKRSKAVVKTAADTTGKRGTTGKSKRDRSETRHDSEEKEVNGSRCVDVEKPLKPSLSLSTRKWLATSAAEKEDVIEANQCD